MANGRPFFLTLRGVIREVYWLYRLYGLCGYMVMCCMGALCVLGWVVCMGVGYLLYGCGALCVL